MEQQEYLIRVADTNEQFACREEEFVLAAMKRAGCGPIHYGCFGGGCGVCKMKIISGSYSLAKNMSRAHISEQEQTKNIVLICCVKPRGDLVITRV